MGISCKASSASRSSYRPLGELLMSLIMQGISLRVIDSHVFLDFVGTLKVTYNPAGMHHSNYSLLCSNDVSSELPQP